MKFSSFILFFSLLIVPMFALAQAGKPTLIEMQRQRSFDSLKRVLNEAPDDSIKVNGLILLSRLQYDPENTKKEFSLQAISLAEKLHYKKGIVVATNEAGAVYQINKDYQTAINYYKKGIGLSDAYGFNTAETDFYPALLNLYFYLGDYPSAMETISREMTTAEKTNDKKRIAHCENILGYIYFKQENFAASEKYYTRYINMARVLDDSLMLAHAYGELADVYTTEKKYPQAIDVLFRVIKISDQLTANPGKLDINFVNAWFPHYIGKAFYRLGKVYKLMGAYAQAEKYAMESLEYIKKISPPKYDIASYNISLGDIFNKKQEHSKAINYLRYGYDLSREIQHRENTRDAAEYLSQTYALLHQYDSAFYFFKVYTGLKDSIVNNETKMKIAGIQGQYDVAKKDKEITRQHQIRNILIGSFIFLLIVLLLLYNSYRLKQKNKYQRELNRQQNELFNTIVTTQDQERKRIAQDIHDSLGSVLSAAKLKLSSLEESKAILSPDQLEKYQTSLDLLDEASTELRNISHNIMPATLSKLGLEAALQNLIDKIAAHSKLQIHFSAYGFEGRMEEKTEMSIYRIILELLNNIVKHASAEKLSIQLIKYPAYINLMVEDNGKGFNYHKALEEKKGIGLGNILSRVDYMNGSIEVDSSPGKGTTVIIEIPYTA
jgi:two-component system NarL family sensor kinase